MSAKLGEGCFKAYFGVASRICSRQEKVLTFVLYGREYVKTQKSFVHCCLLCSCCYVYFFSIQLTFSLRAYYFGQFIFSQSMKFLGFTIFRLIESEPQRQNFDATRC